jgi:hypothetical protein
MNFHCFSHFSFENKVKLAFFVWRFLIKLYMIVARCKAPLIKLKSILLTKIILRQFIGLS